MVWIRLLTARRSIIRRYGFALLAAGAAVGLITLFEHWRVGTGTVLALDVAAIAFSALYGGLGPSLLTAFLSAFGIDFLFVEPTHALFHSLASYLDFSVDLLFAVGMSSVLSKLRSVVQELEQMADQREQMLNIVAHDLRNPLAGIRMHAANLKRGEVPGGPEGKVARIAGQIEASTRRMDRLVGDLLDSERIRSGHYAVLPEWVNADELVQDAVRTVAGPAGDGKVAIETEIASPDRRLFCDYAQILRVVGNVLGNAVKFSPSGSRIRVRFERSAGRPRFVVQDEGPGIREKDLEHLFDRYWQAEESAHRGTGLGLYISAGIVKAHGGAIHAESELGKGSRFTIEFPAGGAEVGRA